MDGMDGMMAWLHTCMKANPAPYHLYPLSNLHPFPSSLVVGVSLLFIGIFGVWMRILKQTPNSILWLLQFPASGQRAICRAAEGHGIPRDRVVFTEVRAKEVYPLCTTHNCPLALSKLRH